MVKISIAYATCLWNHTFSSSGRNLILGRNHRRIVWQTGRRIKVVSQLRTRPAPRDIHIDKFRVTFKGSNRESEACFHLIILSQLLLLLLCAVFPWGLDFCTHHPYANVPRCAPQNSRWKRILEPVNCLFSSSVDVSCPASFDIFMAKDA
jgi:hypothetical protein